MRIAIIAWGSLIWDPRELPLDGNWHEHGPQLPLEFSRVSSDDRLTLVIDYDHGATVETFYATSPRTNLSDAITDLRAREGTVEKRIGFIDAVHHRISADAYPDHRRASVPIRSWLDATAFDAAIWTALPSNFESKTGRPFTVENAIAYLEALPLSVRAQALNYVANAPCEVVTPLRRKLVELGWIEEPGKRG